MMEITEKSKDMTEHIENQFCDEIIHWLARHLDSDYAGIEAIFNENNARLFLFIWPVFEKEVFEKNMTLNKINGRARMFENHHQHLDLEGMTKRFHARYKNCNEVYQRLINREPKNSNESINRIFNKKYDDVLLYEKMKLLFFVTYRYRNNIFHGNKDILNWDNNEEQIRDCITFMIKIIEINKALKEEKASH